MSENFFEQFGVTADDVSENPYSIEDPNYYPCMVTSVDIKNWGPNKDIPHLVIELTIQGGKNAGKSATDSHRLKPWTAQERASQGDHEAMNARLLSNYKKALLAYGIPEAALNAFNPTNRAHIQKLVGIKGVAFFGPQKNNPEFNSVRDFKREELVQGNSSAESAPSTTASAPSTSSSSEVDMDALAGW